jgi:hypothetical protein
MGESRYNSWKTIAGRCFSSTDNISKHTDCYGTEGKTMDLLVSVMEEYKCPLYDHKFQSVMMK